MAVTDYTAARPRPQVVAHSVPRKRASWVEWVTTVDHKRIGIMYLFLTFAFFVIGGVEEARSRGPAGTPHDKFRPPQVFSRDLAMQRTRRGYPSVIPSAPNA